MIQSELGRGTTISIFMPRYAGDAETSQIDQASASPTGSTGQTVLVVDDEASVRYLIDEVLRNLGYSVIGPADGTATLKVLQSAAQIDLLITNVGLPNGMNGRQVADAARALRPALKILFITGYAENAAVGNGHLEPGMELLTKPFALDALAAKVADMEKKAEDQRHLLTAGGRVVRSCSHKPWRHRLTRSISSAIRCTAVSTIRCSLSESWLR